MAGSYAILMVGSARGVFERLPARTRLALKCRLELEAENPPDPFSITLVGVERGAFHRDGLVARFELNPHQSTVTLTELVPVPERRRVRARERVMAVAALVDEARDRLMQDPQDVEVRHILRDAQAQLEAAIQTYRDEGD